MSNQKQNANRPTDPFGGPPRRSNTTSIIVVAIAIAFFALTPITNGGLGNLLGGASSPSTAVAPTENTQAAAEDEESAKTDATQVAPAIAIESPTEAAASATDAQGVQTPAAAQQPSPTANAPPAERASDLPTTAYDDLPPEAQETIVLIETDGPFPYNRDGITFQNRERILPTQPEGYYREYTVITPGSSDRGARRIVTGEEGEMYYTDDHYESFSEIMR